MLVFSVHLADLSVCSKFPVEGKTIAPPGTRLVRAPGLGSERRPFSSNWPIGKECLGMLLTGIDPWFERQHISFTDAHQIEQIPRRFVGKTVSPVRLRSIRRPPNRRAARLSGPIFKRKQPCLSAGLSLQAATECRSLQFNSWLGPFDGFPPNSQMQRGRYKPG